MNNDYQHILNSESKIRLISGKPGVGKTFFGCQIAEYELFSTNRIQNNQKILFLSFARNAISRIRETYISIINTNDVLSDKEKKKRISTINNRVNINTFHGFFWWLVESYGRYLPNYSKLRKLWLLGNSSPDNSIVPDFFTGVTFKDLENLAIKLLENTEIRVLISKIYPLIIIDEFQDVSDSLYNFIFNLSKSCRLVLLRGPGQCLYEDLYQFKSADIYIKCLNDLTPEIFELQARSKKNRFTEKISYFVQGFDNKNLPISNYWPIRFFPVSRLTKNGFPVNFETKVAKLSLDMHDYITRNYKKNPSICILTSTNQGVIEIFDRILKGNDTYKIKPMIATLHTNNLMFLHYGRLILELLKAHWSCFGSLIDIPKLNVLLTALIQEKTKKSIESNNLHKLCEELVAIMKSKRKPNSNSPSEKLFQDLCDLNIMLSKPKSKLSKEIPSTPFSKHDVFLLNNLAKKIIETIRPSFMKNGQLLLKSVEHNFEKAILHDIIFEKQGIERGIQVMTIHKSKGREFDGVVLALEDNYKAYWRADKGHTDHEILDLYRVAITRARYAIGIVGFNDLYDKSHNAISDLLFKGLRK